MAPGILDAHAVAQLVDGVEAEVLLNRRKADSANKPADKMPASIDSISNLERTIRPKRASSGSELLQDTKRVKVAKSQQNNRSKGNIGRQRLLDSAASHANISGPISKQNNRDAAAGNANTGQALWERAPPKLTSLQRALRRQTDSSVDNQDYERLLHFRRTERIVSVDRYVPASATSKLCQLRVAASTSDYLDNTKGVTKTTLVKGTASKVGFTNLPEAVQDKILTLALVRAQTIKLDFSWHVKNFLQSHTTIPLSHDTVALENTRYSIPRSTSRVQADIQSMHTKLSKESNAQTLLHHARTHSRRLAPEGVNTSLLHVSRYVHGRAARMFYSGNTFHFPSPEAGFMTLEAFLITVGSTNASYLRSLRIHAPLWHAGVASDAVEGAMLDALSPATRFAVLKPPGEDRLLSAIETCTSILAKAGNLKSFELDLLYPEPARHFISQSAHTNLGLVRQEDAAAFVERKKRGIELLKLAIVKLATTSNSKPVVRILSVRPVTPVVAREFRFILTSIIREAEKYG